MPPRLVPLDDGPTIEISYPVIFVGRHPDCDVRINSRKVSRRHCCIAQIGDKLIVRDLGSTNGIRINGRRVSEATLEPNDVITIAHLRYQYVAEGNGEPDDIDVRPIAEPASE